MQQNQIRINANKSKEILKPRNEITIKLFR